MYGTDRDITYQIALATNSEYSERITHSQILPQPRVGSHQSDIIYA